jgi:TonB family protein
MEVRASCHQKGASLRVIVRTFVVLLAFATVLGEVLKAEDNESDAVALVQRAKQQEDLRAEGNQPFELRSQIQVQGNHTPVQGAYRLVWETKHRWVEKLTIGDFQRVRFGTPDGYRQIRSLDYSPQAAFSFDRAMDINALLLDSLKEKTSRIKNRRIDGADLMCVEIRKRKTNAFLWALCMDPSSAALLRAEFGDPANARSLEHTIVEYSQFSNLSSKRYPLHIRFREEHAYSMEISMLTAENASGVVAHQIPQVPENGEFWAQCDEVVPGELKTTIAPHIPEMVRSAHQQGTVSIYMVIEKDGSVSHLKVLQSASALWDQATQEAVQKWKYNPPTCNGSPIRSETVVDVSFSLLP